MVHAVESLLVVTNTDAGSTDEASLESSLSVLREGADVQVCRTSMPSELESALHRRGGRTVVVAGGDGTLHNVVSVLHRRNELADAVVALLPFGTGNDFARGLGLPLDPAAAAQVVLDGVVRRLDLLEDCRGGVVVNAAHVGVGADAARRASSLKPRFGRFAYPLGAVAAGVRARPLHVRVEADSRVLADFDRPVLMVGVSNAPTIGGGLPFAPLAHPGDGRAEVMVSFAVGPLARAKYAVSLSRQRHLERPDVLHLRASKVSIVGQRFDVNADGELRGPEQHLTWKVVPQRLRMVVPA